MGSRVSYDNTMPTSNKLLLWNGQTWYCVSLQGGQGFCSILKTSTIANWLKGKCVTFVILMKPFEY